MFIVAISLGTFCQPLIWAQVVNSLQLHGISSTNFNTLLLLLLLTLGLEVLFWCFHGPARVMESCNAFKIRANYRKSLLKGIMTLPLEWHTDHHSGDTIDKIEKGTSALFNFSENTFEIIYALVRMIGSYIMLAYLSSSAAFIVFGVMMISVYITIRFDQVLIGQYKELNRAENHIAESVFDAISNITTVIILRVERLVFESIVHKIDKPYELDKRNNKISETKWFLTSMCCSIMTVIVLGSYFWQHYNETEPIMLGHVFLLISYLGKMSETFFDFTSKYGDIVQRKTKVQNAEEVARNFKLVNFNNHTLPPAWKEISVSDLNFSYQTVGKDRIHLDGIGFSLRRGERIAFIGESGSGKTTLLKIIRNLHAPQSITLHVDGVPVVDGFAGIARDIALVPQTPEIFASTILNNITLGAEYSTEVIDTYIQMACFGNVVPELPNGLESCVNEKGVNLSGGQQQRLALARGLLACLNKDIILLDEPTSNVDRATEAEIFERIFTGMSDKTIIASLHGIHLLPLFDRIFVFDKGKLVAEGTSVEELLKVSPHFRRLHARKKHRTHMSVS